MERFLALLIINYTSEDLNSPHMGAIIQTVTGNLVEELSAERI